MAGIPQPAPQSTIPEEDWSHLRSVLIRYFSHHPAPDPPDDLAQIVVTRILGKLADGMALTGDDALTKYGYTVAYFVLQESWKKRHSEELTDKCFGPPPQTQGLNSGEVARLVEQIHEQMSSHDIDVLRAEETEGQAKVAEDQHTTVKNIRVKRTRLKKRLQKLIGLRMR